MPSDHPDGKRRSVEQAALSKVVASNAFQRDAIIDFLDRFDMPSAITVLRPEPRENAVLFANLAFSRHFGWSRSRLLLSSVVDFVRARSQVLAFVRRFIDALYQAGRSKGAISTYTDDRRRFLTTITSYRFRGFDNDDYALSFVEPMREITRGRR
jgi:hypothetical protein